MVQYRVEDGPIKKALDTGRCPRCLCQMQPVDVHGHQPVSYTHLRAHET